MCHNGPLPDRLTTKQRLTGTRVSREDDNFIIDQDTDADKDDCSIAGHSGSRTNERSKAPEALSKPNSVPRPRPARRIRQLAGPLRTPCIRSSRNCIVVDDLVRAMDVRAYSDSPVPEQPNVGSETDVLARDRADTLPRPRLRLAKVEATHSVSTSARIYPPKKKNTLTSPARSPTAARPPS